MNKHKIVGIALLAGSALLTGCADTGQPASQPYNQPYSQPASPAQGSYPTSSQNYASGYGVIEAIDVAPAASSSPVNAGTVLGGVVGGLLGNQVGSGSGRTAATVAGAVGGAVVGNQIEKAGPPPVRPTKFGSGSTTAAIRQSPRMMWAICASVIGCGSRTIGCIAID
ncbi:glycine zipper 2TM domain-containing protein [Undibacterium arcticum]|uniref:glycine zipper 2TM domain-containing protein n=1 Tax=Undibacterium arcticum TaxID=1762892 RepID=UPI00361E173E